MKKPLHGMHSLWKALPEALRRWIRSILPTSAQKLGTEFGPRHRLPIAYGDLETNIPVRRSVRAPWMKYDRHTRPYHEPLATATYIREIEPGDVVWDLGSRFGYETVLAATLNDHPELVHTFEMTESKIWKLQRLNRLDFDGKLNINHVAVGERTSGDHSPPKIRLDNYAENHGKPDFITMDIETAEIPALIGMRTTMESTKPTLLIEWHGTAMDHEENPDIVNAITLLRENYTMIKYCENYREQGSEWETLDLEVPPINCQILAKDQNRG